jgi:hypothetical protein
VTGRDDYFEDMDRADEFGAAAGRAGGPNAETAAVTRFLVEMSSLAEVDAPAPTAELEAILTGLATGAARRRALHRRLAVRAALVAAATVAGLIAAAANHTLPEPAQRVVSNVVNSVTPFHIDPGTGKPPATVPPARHHLGGEHEPGGRSDDRLGAPTSDGTPSSERSDDGEGPTVRARGASGAGESDAGGGEDTRDSVDAAPAGSPEAEPAGGGIDAVGSATGGEDVAGGADGGNSEAERPVPTAQPTRAGTRSTRNGGEQERKRDD